MKQPLIACAANNSTWLHSVGVSYGTRSNSYNTPPSRTWERRIPGLRRADAERVVLHQVGTDGRNSRLESVGPGHKGREAQADGLLGGGDQRALIANIEIVHIWWAE